MFKINVPVPQFHVQCFGKYLIDYILYIINRSNCVHSYFINNLANRLYFEILFKEYKHFYKRCFTDIPISTTLSEFIKYIYNTAKKFAWKEATVKFAHQAL